MNPHLIFWELGYLDGRTLSEADGVPYGRAPRNGVQSIRLISSEHHQVLLNLEVRGSEKFFYRRRTQMIQGGPPRILYVLGVLPDFQVVFDPSIGEVRQVPVDVDPMEFEK